ncbi:MAG: MT-A70 family methyltransferase [Gemmataceae bacterium]
MSLLPAAAGHVVTDLAVLLHRGCRFCCIYADPPWRYDRTPRGAAARHYPTLSTDEIAALPVADLAADACHLHLWTTHSMLFAAKQVMDSWGFAYKAAFVWVKPQIGTGHYWRSAAEFLLLGVKGELTFLDRTIPSWLCADRHDHSGKPEAVRRLVERVSPGPYLELFGRRAAHGWVVFGNEVTRGLFDGDVIEVGTTQHVKTL